MEHVLTRHKFKSGLGFRLSRAAAIIQSSVEDALSPHGLTRHMWIILASIHFDGKSTATEVSKFVGIERTAVSRMISRLEQDGLLLREKSDKDRRASKLSVTHKGEALCQIIPDLIQTASTPHLLDLSPNQIAQLGELLDLIQPGDAPVWRD